MAFVVWRLRSKDVYLHHIRLYVWSERLQQKHEIMVMLSDLLKRSIELLRNVLHATLLSPVVTIRTTRFNTNKFYFLPTLMCFVCISEQTAIISLCNINWLVCITETERVYCAVRTGSLYITFLYNPLKPSGHYIYRQFNIHKLYVLSTQYIYVFCVDLRTNSDHFPIQH